MVALRFSPSGAHDVVPEELRERYARYIRSLPSNYNSPLWWYREPSEQPDFQQNGQEAVSLASSILSRTNVGLSLPGWVMSYSRWRVSHMVSADIRPL